MDDFINIKDKLPELKEGIGDIAVNSGYVKVLDNGKETWGIYFENDKWSRWLDACFLLNNKKCKYENGLLQNVTHWKYMNRLPKGAIRNTIIEEK